LPFFEENLEANVKFCAPLISFLVFFQRFIEKLQFSVQSISLIYDIAAFGFRDIFCPVHQC